MHTDQCERCVINIRRISQIMLLVIHARWIGKTLGAVLRYRTQNTDHCNETINAVALDE